MAEYKSASILITGASGQLGRAVLEGLKREGATKIIAGTRTPETLNKALATEVRPLDFDRPETLPAAFAGVERMLLISTDSLDIPGKRIEQHRRAIEAAVQAGVQHIVYTSAPAPAPSPAGGVVDDHFWTEAALFSQPDLRWTVLRNELYAELILMAAQSASASGHIYSATAGKGRAYVTRQNCADAAVAALLRAEGNNIVDITGREAITQNKVASLLTNMLGKPIQHLDVPPAALRQGMLQAGLPPALVEALVHFDVQASQGYHAIVSTGFQELTGHQPTSVESFLQQASQKF